MSKISAIILTKNSENLIADCIDSVSFCDEIIVIDDSSIDRTVELAKHLGARVYNFNSKSFSEKRNFGLKKAKYKWLFYLDEDERVTKELKINILNVIKTEEKGIGAYRVQRKNYYLGQNEWPYIEKLERLFVKDSLKGWSGKLHESPLIDGEVSNIQGFLNHFTHQDITKMVEKTAEWSGIEAKLRHKSNHPKMTWWRFFRVMISAFYNSFIKQKGYKAGIVGLIESIYQSFSMFITYARLWELQQKKSS